MAREEDGTNEENDDGGMGAEAACIMLWTEESLDCFASYQDGVQVAREASRVVSPPQQLIDQSATVYARRLPLRLCLLKP